MAAAGMSAGQILQLLRSVRRKDFWDRPRGMALARWIASGFKGREGLVEGRAFEQALEELLPVKRFEDCPKGCVVVGLDIAGCRRVVFTSGPIARAVRASGAVPVMMRAVWEPGRVVVDGGVVDKAPVKAACEMLGARSVVVHLLHSSSLEQSPAGQLRRVGAPLLFQRRAVDAARMVGYREQLQWARERGVEVVELSPRGLERVGPWRMERGPKAFEQARAFALRELKALL